jgi:hypothetical protein
MNKKQFIKEVKGILYSFEQGFLSKEECLRNIELMIEDYRKTTRFLDIPIKIREQMRNDEVIFGNAFCSYSNGKYERIDPMCVIIKLKNEVEK